ncbi:uncharacterized protein SCHCODRAFT_02642057 [Schizophyllum commune H4-8]|uniref:PPM-type phosphatase domain-containing protein n=1 Tax=Schizophyllum commune (strain H4-8 / FGSC 9210) TaxID=578458 RepID=D8QM15_SCHCM|nr:uncharacterized protein SCHCODRAFT_02642057 [Schizophyllum commune H4-8]KAI5886575.1 hypothetical protein SCHCODRAFT_02642057 [Schizophyllum commune H4-8]
MSGGAPRPAVPAGMRSFQKLYSAALTPRSRVRSNSLYTSAGHTPYPSGFPPGYYAPYPPSSSNGAGGSGGGGAYTNGSSFFDSPPPPAPRISTSRLKGESQTSHSSHGQSSQSTQSSQASHQHAPYSLALTSPHNQHGTHTLLPTANSLSSSYAASYDPTSCSLQGGHPDEAEFVTGRRRRRKGHKYHFDLAAYGMPKRRCGSSSPRDGYLRPSGEPYTDLSVQVGEDAYFLRDNAMGVADGVGGWARVKDLPPLPPSSPTPSALFSRRLMHFCSDEIAHTLAGRNEDVSDKSSRSPSVIAPEPSHPKPTPLLSRATSPYSWPWKDTHAHTPSPLRFEVNGEMAESATTRQDAATAPDIRVDDSYRDPERDDNEALSDSEGSEYDEELEDALDVLQILQRAYDNTLREHVVTVPATGAPAGPEAGVSASAEQAGEEPAKEPERIPLLSGSSTALIAVLEQLPAPPSASAPSATGWSSRAPSAAPSRDSSRVRSPSIMRELSKTADVAEARDRRQSTSVLDHLPAWTSMHEDAEDAHLRSVAGREPVATVKIAHVGDCMGMLIREDEIVWRTEEMWWNYNTPVQLRPQHSELVAIPTDPSQPATPAPSTKPGSDNDAPPTPAQVFEVPVQEDDILILASDGLSDNLWDEDVLEEVARWRAFAQGSDASGSLPRDSSSSRDASNLRRRTLAGMLSEALCQRARRVSEMRAGGRGLHVIGAEGETREKKEEMETPFSRRAREQRKPFAGGLGKRDDISVIVAVISRSHRRGRAAKPQARGRSADVRQGLAP